MTITLKELHCPLSITLVLSSMSASILALLALAEVIIRQSQPGVRGVAQWVYHKDLRYPITCAGQRNFLIRMTENIILIKLHL